MASAITHPLADWILDTSSKGKRRANLEQLKQDLNRDLLKPFPTRKHPYKQVHVLMLCWKHADANNAADLAVVRDFLVNDFNYSVEIYQIEGDLMKPAVQPLMKRFIAFSEKILELGDQVLSIILYNGHGWSNAGSQTRTVGKNLILYPSNAELERESGKATVNSNTTRFGIPYELITNLLTALNGDVLHILSCCNGGGAALDQRHEFLAAATFERPSQRSPGQLPSARFLHCLIAAMTELKEERITFTTAQLLGTMQTQATTYDPPLLTQPVYIPRAWIDESIILTPLVPANAAPPLPPKRSSPKMDRVLLSINMEGDTAVAGELYRWLTSRDRPEYVQEVKMMGYYRGQQSMVVQITLPLAAYAVLCENPAYHFVGYVGSENLMLTHQGRLDAGLPESAVEGRDGIEAGVQGMALGRPATQQISHRSSSSLGAVPLERRADPLALASPLQRRSGNVSGSASSALSQGQDLPQRVSQAPSEPYEQSSSSDKRKRDFTSGSQHPPAKHRE